MPYKDKVRGLEYAKERRRKLKAEDPEYKAKIAAQDAAWYERKKREEEGFMQKRREDTAKWYALHGREHAREKYGYRPLEVYLAEVAEKRKGNAAYMKEWAKTEAGKRARVAAACRKRGITIEEYDKAYRAQHGNCWICNTHKEIYDADRLAIDHCHSTSKFRGLLCGSCNSAIGLFGESEERMNRAIEYLKLHIGT